MTPTRQTPAGAAARFEQIISPLPQLVAADDHDAMLDVLIEVIEFRAALTKPGDGWDALREAADAARGHIRRIITDGALKAMDDRVDAIRTIAQQIRAIADELAASGKRVPNRC